MSKTAITITRKQALEIFKACGWKNADKWSDMPLKKLTKKFKELAEQDENGELKEPKDTALAELLADILDAIDENGGTDGAISISEKPEKKTTSKKGEDKKKKKSVQVDDDDDDDEDGSTLEEDAEEEDDEDDEPRTKKDKKMKDKKKKKKHVEEEGKKKKKKKHVEEKPSKKDKKKDKKEKKKEKGEATKRDKFGNIVGSNNSKLMACLSRKAKTMAELKEESGLTQGYYELLNQKIEQGYVEKTDKGFRLAK